MDKGKILSLIVAAIYLAIYVTDVKNWGLLLPPILGLMFIWRPDVMIHIKKFGQGFDPDTPGCVLVAIGWLVLLLPLLLGAISYFAGSGQ